MYQNCVKESQSSLSESFLVLYGLEVIALFCGVVFGATHEMSTVDRKRCIPGSYKSRMHLPKSWSTCRAM
jgi:hypothetical protein